MSMRGALIAVAIAAGVTAGAAAQRPEAVQVSDVRAQQLVRLVRQDCGSCHGLTLKGGLGPALLPDALRDKPQEGLRDTILLGRPGTAMPPWQGLIEEHEADWIVARLMTGFPEERRR